MKRILILFSALFLVAIAVSAKKVEVTIDGTVYSTQTKLYLIINEDTAHAQLLPIVDGHFSVTVKVDRDAFIRIHDWKQWPERAAFVLVPDSRHITIDWRNGTIEGSKKSQQLKDLCWEIKKASPEGFHVDVFSEDPEAWAQARETERRMREQMLMEQKDVILRTVNENRGNNFPAWIYFCYHDLFDGDNPYNPYDDRLNRLLEKKDKWTKHPIMKLLKQK